MVGENRIVVRRLRGLVLTVFFYLGTEVGVMRYRLRKFVGVAAVTLECICQVISIAEVAIFLF